jgi:hypothetical protein
VSGNEFVPDPSQPKWKQKIAERLWRDSQEAAAKKPADIPTEDYSQFMDSVPDVSADATEDNKRLEIVDRQQFIDRISILDVYKKLTGNSVRVSAGQTNSIMGFCVSPSHNNTNSEAMQMSTDNTWVCHACEQGASQVGMVAFSMGVAEVGSGKLRGQSYAKAEEQLLQMFGWEKHKLSNGKTAMTPPVKEEPKPKPVTKKDEPQKEDPRPLAVVQDITDGDEEEDSIVEDVVPYEWRDNMPANTFLGTYMEAGSRDDCVEVFHLAYALEALAVTVGKQVVLEDQYDIYPNLYICLLGDSGTGKSKASQALKHVLGTVAEWTPDQEPQIGARIVANPSSGSGLVTAFRRNVEVPKVGGKQNETAIIVRGDVKAIIEYGELESLTSRMAKDTTGLRTTILDLFDGAPKVGSIAKGDGANGYYCENPFACQVTTLQPRNIPNLLSSKDVVSGFVNRYMFFYGAPKIRMSRSKPILPYFDEAIAHLEKIRDWANDSGTRRVMEWTEDAGDYWDAWFHNVQEKHRIKNADMLNRVDIHFKKLSMLFAVNEMSEIIELDHVVRAIGMFDWILSTYQLVDKSVGVPPMTQLEEKILAIIQRSEAKKPENPVTVGAINKAVQNNGNKVSREEITRALTNLERAQELKRVEPGKNKDGTPIKMGRPTERWCTAS